ncbi:MAG: biotin/lipoyl-containing protein, partial [Mycobacteriales bacterium]
MTRIKEFALPDLGEGLTDGEILRWLVAVGDRVVINQPIVEVETAKAAVELPSPHAGVVTKLFHEAGTTVEVGQSIIAFDTAPDAPDEDAASPPESTVSDSHEALAVSDAVPAPAPEAPLAADDRTAADADLSPDATPGGRTAVLVGYGPRAVSAKRRPRKDTPTAPARVSAAAVGAAAERLANANRVKAKPPVRRMARQYG